MAEKTIESSILDAISGGVIVIAADRTILHWNAWIAAASGCPATRAEGRLLTQVLTTRDVAVLDGAIDSALAVGASTLLTNALHPALLPLKTRSGGTLYHDTMVSAVGDPTARRCLVQLVDVTASAHRERFLRDRQNARYDALVESAPDVILNVDSDGIIRLANPAATAQFGYAVGELVGREATLLFEDRGAWPEIWRSVNSGTASVKPSEVIVRRKDGSSRYFEVSAARWEDGIRTFTTAILRDTTDRRAVEVALRQSERESRANADALAEVNAVLKESGMALNAVDRRKDEFLATLAHELRNPLAPLRNGLELLKLTKDDPALAARTRQMMELQLGQMVRLIDDLLDVSRINNDRIELNKEHTSLEKVLRQAVETSSPLIDSQQHKLTIDIPRTDVALEGDVVRLTQVFANLLNNAAKYTPSGGRIAIKAEYDGGWATVRIVDNGVGIPKEMLSTIFDMFMQVDRSLERAQGGLGIGLSLVKRLVQMHAGTVEARSAGSGAGSEFIVRLPVVGGPAAAAGKAAGHAAVAARPNSHRILVADDNEDSATSLATILTMLGHETRTAYDGAAALEIAEEFRPDVVLLDIGMPKLNGYETARQLRATPDGPKLFLVALTGWGQDEDRRRSADAGFDNHLVKPVAFEEIQKLLAALETEGRPS